MSAELLGLAAQVARERRLPELGRIVARGLREVLGALRCDVFAGAPPDLRALASCDASGIHDSPIGPPVALSDFPLKAAATARVETLVIASSADPRLTDAERDDLLRTGAVSELWIPLAVQERVVGAVGIRDARPRDSAEILGFVGSIAEIIAGAFANAELIERADRQTTGLRELVQLGQLAPQTADPDALVLATANRLCEAIGVPLAEWLVRSPVDETPGPAAEEGRAAPGPSMRYPEQATANAGDRIVVKAAGRSRRAKAGGPDTVWSAGTPAKRALTPGEIAMAETISGIAILSIHNSQLAAGQREQSTKLATLLETSRLVAATGGLEEALGIVARAVAKTLLVPQCLIYELDEAADVIIPRASYQASPSGWGALGSPSALSDLPTAQAVLAGGVAREEQSSDPDLDSGTLASMQMWGQKTCLTLPFRVGREYQGLLVACEQERERHFSEEETALVRGYGEIAAVAIQNDQLLRRLEERSRRLAFLADAGQAIAADMTLEKVLPEIASHGVQALGAYSCHVFEYVEGTGSIVERAYRCVDPEAAHQATAWALDDDDWGIGGLFADRAVVERRLSDPALGAGFRKFMDERGVKSCLVVPLILQELPIGLLVLSEIDREREFGEDEREYAAVLGRHAAAAIHSARQFSRLEEQNRVLDVLLDAGRTTTSAIRLADVMPLLVRKAAEAVRTPLSLIWEYSPDSETLVEREAFHALGEYSASGEEVFLRDHPELAGSLFAAAPRVETLSDPELDPATRASMEKRGEQTRLSVPLAYGEESLGILVLSETEREREFTPPELGLAAGLADRAGIALHNARLYSELERQNRELTDRARRERLVNEAGAELASSRDLGQTLVSAAQRFAELLNVNACDIYELRNGHDLVCVASVVDGEDFPEWLGMHMSVEDHKIDQLAIAARHPITVNSMDDPRLTEAEREKIREWGEESILVMPLIVKGRVLGTVQLMSDRGRRAFTPDIVATAEGIGHMTALALENARHFDRLRTMNTELEVRAQREALVSEASLELTSSLDLERVLTATAFRFASCLSATACDIYRLEGDELICIASVLDGIPYEARIGTRRSLAEWKSAGLAVKTCSRQLITSTDDPRLGRAELGAMREWGEKTLLILPLIAHDRVIGTIELSDTRGDHPLGEEDLATAEAVSRMAALAIDNADLFAHHQLHVRRLASLLHAGRSITSSIASGDVLAAIAQTAAEALGSPECIIFDHDAAAGTLTPTAVFQETPTGYDGLGKPLSLSDWPGEAALIESRESLVETISDPDLDPARRGSMEELSAQTSLSAPLHFGEESLGILMLIETVRKRVFSEDDLELVRGLSEQAAIAIHNARVFERLRLRTSETEVLNDMARETSSSLNVADIARAAVAQLHRLVGFARASMLLIQLDGSVDVVFCSDAQDAADRSLLDDLDLFTQLQRERIAVVNIAEGAATSPDGADGGERVVSIIGLFEDDVLIGALALSAWSQHAPPEADRRLLEGVGAHLSLAIKNARLYEDVRGMHLASLRALSSALTAKDYYTVGHTARVAAYATMLAEELGWSGQAIAELEEVAYLHDMGKLAVPDRVLLKAGPLNDEEWVLMRMHPIVSSEIVEPLLGERLVAGVLYHHERYDGGGYPEGLAGEEIPEIARLMCVVDAYDAMSTRRSYYKALDYGQCRAELDAGRGTQFDPQMVDAFLRVLNRIKVRRVELQSAAREAAAAIDAAKHALLLDDVDESRPEYAEISGILRDVAAQHPQVQRLLTETQVDDRRLMIIVDSAEDPAIHADIHHLSFADNEEIEMFLDRRSEDNVVDVDAWGTWLSSAAPVRDASGAVAALVSACETATGYLVRRVPVSDVVRTFAGLARSAAARLTQAEADAVTDALTGLYNHRYFQQRLEAEILQIGEGAVLSLLFCDVDNFKDLNDHYGHAAGDGVLRGVADVITRSARRVDIAARYGGDEFAVILVDADVDKACEVAERIRSGVQAAGLHPKKGVVTLSIGVATLPLDGLTKEGLIESADRAMYRAKSGGRNRCARL